MRIFFLCSIIINFISAAPHFYLILTTNNPELSSKNIQAVYDQTYTDWSLCINKNLAQQDQIGDIYRIIHDNVPDDSVVVLLDDTILLHPRVLEELAQEYCDGTRWLGIDKPSVGIFTFRAWLFKNIKLEDLVEHGVFCSGGAKNIFMPHLLRLATYIQTPLIDRVEKLSQEKVDMIVYSKDRPMQLYAFLESAHKLITGLASITVIYHAANQDFRLGYRKVKEVFPEVHFVRQSMRNPRQDFKTLTLKILHNIPGAYLIFAVDDIIVKDFINMQETIKVLEQTFSYGAFFRLGTHTDYCYSESRYQGIPPLMHIRDDLYAWQFKMGVGDWKYPNNLDMTLYRKADIIEAFSALNYNSPNTLEGSWAFGRCPDLNKIAVCYALSKIVNIPLNIVQHDCSNHHMNLFTAKQLLQKFNAGLKIDISRLFKIINKSAHIDFVPTFIAHG